MTDSQPQLVLNFSVAPCIQPRPQAGQTQLLPEDLALASQIGLKFVELLGEGAKQLQSLELGFRQSPSLGLLEFTHVVRLEIAGIPIRSEDYWVWDHEHPCNPSEVIADMRSQLTAAVERAWRGARDTAKVLQNYMDFTDEERSAATGS